MESWKEDISKVGSIESKLTPPHLKLPQLRIIDFLVLSNGIVLNYWNYQQLLLQQQQYDPPFC